MFNFFDNNTEWQTIDNATAESVEFFGIPCKYVQRTLVNPDYLFGEDNALSEFNNFIDIKLLLIDQVEGFGGSHDMFTRFGLQLDDSITFAVHRDTIRAKLGGDPLVSDIIFFPFDQSVLEIYDVDPDERFFPLGRQTTFKLQCRKWQYSHERFNTDIPELDALNDVDSTETNEDNDASSTVSSVHGSTVSLTDILNFDEDNPYKSDF